MKRLYSCLAILAAFLCLSAVFPGVASADKVVTYLVTECRVRNGKIVISGAYSNITDSSAAIWGTDVEVIITDYQTKDVIYKGTGSFDLDVWLEPHTNKSFELTLNDKKVTAPHTKYRYKIIRHIKENEHYALY